MPHPGSESLQWVSKDLTSTVQDARAALEDYVEGERNRRSLETCAERLHIIQGVLRMVEVYGAALLAEEMEKVCAYLLASPGGVGNEDDALDALTRAMVQLPVYLERVIGGGRDIALVLLPLLNDLRAVRGHPLLSEGTLLLLNVAAEREPVPGAAERPVSGADPVQLARLLRPRFQLALLGWIKGERTPANLAVLAEVTDKLEQAARKDTAHRLWSVLGGVIEALREQSLDANVSIKRLLGQTDRAIKRLIDEGEESLAGQATEELLNNLLYYVARARRPTARVSALRAKYQLDDLLPSDEMVEEARERLSGPSIKLMRTVAAAIKEDLSKVKDTLDIFVRTGKRSRDELAAQVDLLKKIADTLGVLGLGGLRGRVQDELKELDSVAAGSSEDDDQVLERIAGTLLQVEDNLDDQLLGLIMPQSEGAAVVPVEDEEHVEYRQVTEAVVRECILNLSRVKEAITQAVEQPREGKGLDAVPPLLRGITAALLMLNRTRAVAVVEGIGEFVKRCLRAERMSLRGDQVDRLADAIVSLEYYLETVQAGRADPWYMLDNAESCLAVLRKPEAYVEELQAEPAEPYAATLVLDHPAETAAEEPVAQVEATPAAEHAGAATAAPAEALEPSVIALATLRPDAEGTRPDPEIIELFIEEAKDELESLRSSLAAWIDDVAQQDALTSARRSFHTLKGSGRMVGAEAIGEFAWAAENLLNRVIDGTRPRSPAMLQYLRETLTMLPELIEQLEVGEPPGARVGELIRWAEALVRGEEAAVPVTVPRPVPAAAGGAAAPAPPALPAVSPPAEAPAETGEGLEAMDPVLKEIFVKETSGHLAAIRGYLEDAEGFQPPYAVTEALHRSCHTLSGSANMAGVEPAVELAAPWNRYVRKLYDAGAGLSARGLEVCTEVVAAMEAIVSRLQQGRGDLPDFAALVASIGALDEEFEDRAAGAEAEVTVAPAEEPADFDVEIAAIFSDEAAELLDAAEAAFGSWAREWRDEEAVAELRRHLHTLKGGARMAGVRPMGDLSHELETLLIRIGSGDATPGRHVREVFQRGIDELHRMRDVVSAGRYPGGNPELLTTIRGVTEAGVAAPMQPEIEPEVPPVPTLAAEPAVTVPRPEAAPPPPEPAVQPESPAGTAAPPPAQPAPPSAPIISPEVPAPAAPMHPATEPAAAPAEAPAIARRTAAERGDVARVDAALLEELLNNAGEVSIYRARLEQQIKSMEFNLTELSQTVARLRDQLRKLEIETEAQIIHRHQDEMVDSAEFDPLELDRYSLIQQLSRALAESATDVDSIRSLIEGLTREADALLVQQGRVTTALQHGLMQTRMVPFERHAARLQRVVRQVASEVGKRAELKLQGGGELDRQVLERMLPPLEHMLRNALAHGIEAPEQRRAAGKPETGHIVVNVRREGAEFVVEISDDGAGLDIQAIREKARDRGLVQPGQLRSDEQAIQLIFESGFSTATQLTQAAGRGVGMDVVASEVRKLGGNIAVATRQGEGTTFTVRLPFTLAMTQAMIVKVGKELYALPLTSIEGIARVPLEKLRQHIEQDAPYEYGGASYRFQFLAQYIGAPMPGLPEEHPTVPVVLVRAGEHSTALIADELLGSREVVVKSVGPQLSGIDGIAGATIMGDGRIAIILDAPTLLRAAVRPATMLAAQEAEDRRTFVLVVDDSITVRRVTQRLLERNGMRVITAKDGIDALAQLQEHRPDIILLDIEMPRMDGYELATNVRSDERLKDIPIIMITSRVGAKHRARAIEIGVDDYLGKPYQEAQLLDAIEPLVKNGRVTHG